MFLLTILYASNIQKIGVRFSDVSSSEWKKHRILIGWARWLEHGPTNEDARLFHSDDEKS